MESLLELLQAQNANLRQTADALRKLGAMRDELLKQITSSERGELPDERFAALSAESMDPLEEIRYMLLPPVDCVAESFFEPTTHPLQQQSSNIPGWNPGNEFRASSLAEPFIRHTCSLGSW